MPSARLWSLVLLAGCEASDLGIRVDKPWANEAPGVVTAITADGVVLAPTPMVIAPGERLDLSFAESAFELRLAEFPVEDAAGLIACGARLGGTRVPLPAPTGTWKSRFDPETGPESLVPSADPGADFHYDRCDPPTPCDAIRFDFWVVPLPGFNIVHVEWIPGDRWVIAARITNGPESHVGIVSATGEYTDLGTFPVRVSGLAWDRADRVYVALEDGRLFGVDIGTTPALVELTPSGLTNARLSARSDGLVVLYLRGGSAVILAQPPGGGLTATDFPAAMDLLEMASPSKMAVVSGIKVLVWDSSSELWVEEARRLPAPDPDTTLVFSGGSLGAFASAFAYLYEDGEQRALPPPTDLALLSSATAFNDGTLVFGGVGGAAYWKRGAWCPIGTPGVASAFRAAATSPDGKTAASGSDPDSTVGSPKLLVWH